MDTCNQEEQLPKSTDRDKSVRQFLGIYYNPCATVGHTQEYRQMCVLAVMAEIARYI